MLREKRVPARLAGAGEHHQAADLSKYLPCELLRNRCCLYIAHGPTGPSLMLFYAGDIKEHGSVERALLTCSVAELHAELKGSPWRAELFRLTWRICYRPCSRNEVAREPRRSNERAARLGTGCACHVSRRRPVKLICLLLTLSSSSATAQRSFNVI